MPKLETAKYIWVNGKFIFWGDANIHCLSHSLHYGETAFEGIRCYKLGQGDQRVVFRLPEHIDRLYDSAKIYYMEENPYEKEGIKIPYSREKLKTAIIETIKKNDLYDCYIRPFIFRGYGELGVNPLNCPIEVIVTAFPFVRYLGKDALESGVDVKLSYVRRKGFPTFAKQAGHYLNSQLIKIDAIKDGYAEGIALDQNDHISECSGENIFIVKNGKLYTPSLGNSILSGITRHSIITIAKKILQIEVTVTSLPCEMLFIADEVFMTGTWAEITPVRSISKRFVGSGKPGKITSRIQEEYSKITFGENPDFLNWLTFID
jgi:branched-chain amino acid aminotransferase